MLRKGLTASAIVALLLSLRTLPPLASREPPPARLSPLLLSSRPGDDDGKDQGDDPKKPEEEGDEKKPKDKGGDEGADGKEPKKGEAAKPEAKKSGITEEERTEANAIVEVPVSELDQKSPRYISKAKEAPPLVMIRPPAAKPGKASEKAGKKAQVDGSRWGFVDLEKRRAREASFYDKVMALHERQVADESLSESEREEARKQVNVARAEKSRVLLDIDQLICQVEIAGNPKVKIQVISKERQNGMPDKVLREMMRAGVEKSGMKITSEREEKWRGNKMPGYTMIAEGAAGPQWRKEPEPCLLRRTYFLVPRAKGPMALVFFDCWAPKTEQSEQLEKEFEAFIHGTQFN